MPYSRISEDLKSSGEDVYNSVPEPVQLAINQIFLQAAFDSDLGVCRNLIEQGVNINCLDDEGNNAFIIAIRAKHLDLAEFLFNKKIDITCQNHLGLRALDYASSCCDIPACLFLIDCGALKVYDKDDSSILFSAIKNAQNEDVDIIELIKIFDGENFDIVSSENRALHECAMSNRVDLAQYLVTNYDFDESFWRQKDDPLVIAAERGNTNFCRVILANVDKIHRSKFLDLSKVLARQKNIESEMRKYGVLHDGDSFNPEDIAGALFMAVYFRREDDANFFINYLHENHREKLDEIRSADSDSLLHALVDCELYFATMVLLQMDVNVGVKNTKGKTAFIFAVEKESEKMVEAFTRSEVDLRDAEVELGLIKAVRQNNPKMVKRVLAASPDINFHDECGNTALHHAALIGSLEIYEILRDNSARDNLENDEGKTAKQILSEAGIAVEIQPSTSTKTVSHSALKRERPSKRIHT